MATSLLQRLASDKSLELTPAAVDSPFQAANLHRSSSYPVTVVVQDALIRARALWLESVSTDEKTDSISFHEYIDRWFTWPDRAGLGKFCPITKLLFAKIEHNQQSLTLLRDIRLEWQEKLVHCLKHDPQPELTTRKLSKAAEATIGIYFARQFAMQADEISAYPVAPWLEMVRESFRTD